MKIKVINPNTTASMTAKIGKCARAVAGPGVTVDAVNPAAGPESIESHFDDALCLPGLLAEISAGEAVGVDGYVIACFGDPGLLAAREIAVGPVVGIAEAAMRTAAYLGRTFSVVTTLARTVGHSWDLVHSYGLARHCIGVHAADMPVTELETDPAAYGRVLVACREAVALDRCDSVVLGCAGMTDLCAALTADLGLPVIDGVAAAVVTVRGLLDLGLATSKAGEFALPPAKQYPGIDRRLYAVPQYVS